MWYFAYSTRMFATKLYLLIIFIHAYITGQVNVKWKLNVTIFINVWNNNFITGLVQLHPLSSSVAWSKCLVRLDIAIFFKIFISFTRPPSSANYNGYIINPNLMPFKIITVKYNYGTFWIDFDVRIWRQYMSVAHGKMCTCIVFSLGPPPDATAVVRMT